jgi:alpha-2-macroglobulin
MGYIKYLARMSCWAVVGLALLPAPARAVEAARVELFSPQGTVKGVRQVTARFTEPMVPLGDPRLPDPFDIDCAERGTGRWADARNWVYDFERDLPSGMQCRFTLRHGLTTLAGGAVGGERSRTFSTGGPSVIQSLPHEGSESIDEHQVFLLGLDAPAAEASILEHVRCENPAAPGSAGVRIVKGEERRRLLEARRSFVDRYFTAYLKVRGGAIAARIEDRGSRADRLTRLRDGPDSPLVVVQCRLRFPNEAHLRLVWGRGVAAQSGIAGERDQVLTYRTRAAFRARFSCTRVNKDAQCIPVLPMSLEFTAPIPRAEARRIRLVAQDGKVHLPRLRDGGAGRAVAVDSVEFPGPFPEQATFRLHVRAGLKDDAGRTLVNAASFPLQVKTDEDPPLTKFAARFGVVELRAGALLPVTVRNVEAGLAAAKIRAAPRAQPGMRDGVAGRVLAVDTASVLDIVAWLRRMRDAERTESRYDAALQREIYTRRPGDRSIFSAQDRVAAFTVPKPGGSRAFEVVGIPLVRPGLHIVEIASPRLGAALFGEPKPYHVQSAALVTDLALHFKLGRESSLAWVTALDSGKPVADAAVAVHDCGGRRYWEGRTDAQGVARIDVALPPRGGLPGCFASYHRHYLVTARTAQDMTFTFTDWNEGIAPWRFALPQGAYDGPYVATTVFDRTLLRAGETVHMKHLVRRHTGSGFEFVEREALLGNVVVKHQGSDDRYVLPVKWDTRASAETGWTIPQDAKQGIYQVYVVERVSVPEKAKPRERLSGSFRVEAFRVPTMRAVVKPPPGPLVNATAATVDVQVNYLAGGGAGGAPVKLRALMQKKSVHFPDFEGFVFANGNVMEGATDERAGAWRHEGYLWADPEEDEAPPQEGIRPLGTQAFDLDAGGAGRAVLRELPKVDAPHEVLAEFEYRDASGETLTAATRIALWPSRVLVGLKPDGWAASRDKLRFQAMAVDLAGRPVAGVAIRVDLFQRNSYSHRKRLIGGFYAYEHYSENRRVGAFCSGVTDARGLVFCEGKSPVSGNLVLRAQASDRQGNPSHANREVWVAGSEDWWFEARDSDRMDVIPERKRYEPGETAVFQVRMPFREATALITVEREGLLETFVQPLTGKAPVIRLPLRGHYAPNVFVSVLAVRGRVAGVQPTALVDLGKPAFRLGIAEISVGWRAHELKVNVRTELAVYKVREEARVAVRVSRADGSAPPPGTEIALAAVDEGLLELLPNASWSLLESMMKRRGIEVETSTAQLHVVGKRHFGRKAQPQGGGGGRQGARELFDTLLLWRARTIVDESGMARVTVPLNDALTSFRIVAVADGDAGLFGSGHATIRTTQDVMLLSGLPPVVREGDTFRAGFTVRNASERRLELEVAAAARGVAALTPQRLSLAPGAAQDIGWDVTVPLDAGSLAWEVSARAADVSDALRVSQKVIPAVPVRTFQATIAQLERPLDVPVKIPVDAVPGRGGVAVHLRARLVDELAGVREYMERYPYTCLEQLVSQAVALRDEARWHALMARLPTYLDRDGLAKFFPAMREGSDVLTSYLIAIAHEAGWEIPEAARSRMTGALSGFVQGRIVRHSDLPTADLSIRKVAALEALARRNPDLDPRLLSSVQIEPNLWPTSAVLDWWGLLRRAKRIPGRERRIREAEAIVRARLDFQGTTMGFSTERADFLWWLMISGDVNANRVLLAALDAADWQQDVPRLVRGTIGRQQRGRWNTTVANAWGVLAVEKFSAKHEADAVGGGTSATLAAERREFRWETARGAATLGFPWPSGAETLRLAHAGSGRPWVTVQSLAAVPLKAPLTSGYRIARSVTPVEQKTPGAWSRGDVARVRLELEAQSDMTWVAVRDPVPAGAAILGTGLGGDSRILARGEQRQGWVWPAFEERAFDSFRAYYRFVPKGKWTVEYTMRFNNAGRFALPSTRVEALYAPEMFGEIPNAPVEVGQ